MKAMQATGKGKVTCCAQRTADIRDRHPHFQETKLHCLQETCSWSLSSQQLRSDESKALACINGKVKTKISCQLLKDFKYSYDLQAILVKAFGGFVKKSSKFTAPRKDDYKVLCSPTCDLNNCQQIHLTPAHFLHNLPDDKLVTSAPLVLNFLSAKLTLLEKHILKPNFSEWDLDIKFNSKEWTVTLNGFLYNRQYDDINKSIAKGLVTTTSDIVNYILIRPNVMPTVSLDIQILVNDYKMSNDRAQVVVDMANRHQKRGPPEPSSLLNMWTPDGVEVTALEKQLRLAAVRLTQEQNNDLDAKSSIFTIIHNLMIEGLDLIEFEEGRMQDISNKLNAVVDYQYSQRDLNLLTLYHYLIWKTGGAKKWTLIRRCSETNVIPYLPYILEATNMHMNAECVLQGEYLDYEDDHLSYDAGAIVKDSENWKEVNILEFINGTASKNIVGLKSHTIVPIVTSNNLNLSWRSV